VFCRALRPWNSRKLQEGVVNKSKAILMVGDGDQLIDTLNGIGQQPGFVSQRARRSVMS